MSSERAREAVHRLAYASYKKGDYVAWFDALYAEAAGDAALIPWADLKANPNLTDWLDRERVAGDGRGALVVGCGLGDDAAELSRRGFAVTAFDVSEKAVGWARKRFADQKVDFQVADLFQLPASMKNAFDFVFEAYTIQALPHSVRRAAIDAVADTVRTGGQLLVICRGRDDADDPGNMPWPLTRAEIDWFVARGLGIEKFEDYRDLSRDEPVRRFRVVFRR
jgi:SAM-dependent methyltransferase